MQSIEGKVAIVTGASTGIGRGIALELAREGMVVVAAARSADKLATLVEEIEGIGGKAFAVPTDVTSERDVVALFEQTVERAGIPNLLVNNAGIADATPVEDLSLEHWHHVIDTNLTSAYLCAREAIRAMKPAGGGRIVNIGSLSAKSPRPHSMAYTASKFALEGMTRAIAFDGRDHNITCSILHPGQTRSSLVPGITDQKKDNQIDPADLGRLVVYMASLPPEIAVLDALVLPVKVPYLGRG
ncbi:MAG: SDR family oxidoreductase [Nitratireductor sp.]|nr:SDR family oxidoreductase [Nitratireductor sp.]